MAEVLIAPYLPLPERCSLGDWTLHPTLAEDQGAVIEGEEEVIPSGLRRAVRRLVEAYRVDEASLGALIAPPVGEIGPTVDRMRMRLLGSALLAGAVSTNPNLIETEDGSFSGWSLVTAENALLYGHPLTDDGNSYAIQVGVISKVLSGRYAEADEALPKISPPIELSV